MSDSKFNCDIDFECAIGLWAFGFVKFWHERIQSETVMIWSKKREKFELNDKFYWGFSPLICSFWFDCQNENTVLDILRNANQIGIVSIQIIENAIFLETLAFQNHKWKQTQHNIT